MLVVCIWYFLVFLLILFFVLICKIFIKTYGSNREVAKDFQMSIESLDLHTGGSLWRKFKEIKLVLMNDFAPVLSKKLPGGQLPSGKSMAEILIAVRKEIFENYEAESEKKSKAVKGYTRHRFVESWFPVEWDVFTTYGTASPNPEECFSAR